MELERHTQLMYTSCGWFFDEISGIETVQIIAYAGRVLQLAAKLFGEPGAALEAEFLEILARAKSNVPEIGRRRRSLSPLRHRHAHRPRTGRRPLRHQLHLPHLSRGRRALLLRRPSRQPRDLHLRPRPRRPRPRPRPLPHHRRDAKRSASPSSISATRTSPPPSSAYVPDEPEQLEAFTKFSAEIGNAIRRANLPEVIRLIDRFFGNIVLLAHLALRRRAAPHPQHHPQPHPLRDGRVPPQDLRGPRLPAALPHRIRHRRSARARPRRQLRHQRQPAPRHRGRHLRRRRDRAPAQPRRDRPDRRSTPTCSASPPASA